MKCELEIVYRVCDENGGNVIEIGPDPDGLGLTEIRTMTDDGQVGARVCLHEDALELVIECLQRSRAAKNV